MKNTIAEKFSVKQRKVINDLFESSLSEQDVLAKHKIKLEQFMEWMGQEDFASEVRSRILHSKEQANIMIAKYAPAAAVKLIELSQLDSGETARKACLDILGRPARDDEKSQDPETEPDLDALPDAMAGKILALLAEARKTKQ